jgi:putative membrane protein
MPDNPNRARDHLANERTFLAWVRTGVAIVVFGFAIGRFSIAIRQLSLKQGKEIQTSGLSVWLGLVAIVAGVVLTFAGLLRYRQTKTQLDRGTFEPAGFVIDLVAISDSHLWAQPGRLSFVHRNGVPVKHGQ